MAFDQLAYVSLKKNEAAIIIYNKYSGVAVRSPTYNIIFDPTNIPSATFNFFPDVILVTHEHFDHLDEGSVAKLLKISSEKKVSDELKAVPDIISKTESAYSEPIKPKITVVADKTSGKMLKSSIPKENLAVVEPYKEISLEDITIKAYPSNHPQAKTPVTYMVTLENGVKIFHTSDSLPYDQMEEIGSVEAPDIVFCTIGIAPGSSPSTGAKIAGLVKAKLAVPYHGSNFKEFEVEVRKIDPTLKTRCLAIGEVFVYR
jgi:L-ascorbate metabolism protein UlaG (beta-lactamase superfamily)